MIIFFIRKYNDIDHVTPIIYKIAQTGNKEIRVLSLNYSYPIRQDYRLQLLAEKFGIEAEYIYKAFAPTRLHQMSASLLCGTREQETDESKLHYFFRRVYRIFINPRIFDSIIKRFIFSISWAELFCAKFKPAVLVFDWVKPYQYVTESLLKAAREHRIPTVAVPHGIPMFVNELFSEGLIQAGRPLQYGDKYQLFDHFVVQFNHLKKMAVRTGLPAERVHVLGSTRFCDEWRQVHAGLVSHINKNYHLGGEDKLKVVFMDTLSVYRINVEAMLDSLQRLSKLRGLQLLIKPHTRSNRLSTMALGQAAKIVDKVPSGVLCEWADVIIGTSSSILLEAYRLNKLLLYPKFFHENTMLFEDFGACWNVGNYDELEAAILTLMKDPGCRPYSEKAVQRVLTEIVCGGLEERDVLHDYSDFILGLANQRQGHGGVVFKKKI